MFLTASFVSLAFFAMSAIAQVPPCARNYTVKARDTCDSISAAQHVSTYQLAHVNADKIDSTCNNIIPGELLCLGIIGQDCNVTTVVKSGDSCVTIASKAGISVPLLRQNNPNVNSTCANIYPGEVLCVANITFVHA